MHPIRRLVILALALALVIAAPPADAQSFLNKVKQKAQGKAEQKAEQKTDEALDKAAGAGGEASKSGDAKSGDGASPTASTTSGGSPATSEADQLKPGQGAWANYDFKPGQRVVFADDFMNDEVGDFPRRFEFVNGTMDVVEWQGSRWLRLTTTSEFAVSLPEQLPARYTLEFDYAVPQGEMWIYTDGKHEDDAYLLFGNGGWAGVGGNGPHASSQPSEALTDKVVRARVMADGAYVKLYINDKRVANVPNYDPARGNRILFWVDAREEKPAMFGNFRIAAGGRKLYDALAEKGRVATQGIYFDTGSDRIRPESSPTLKEIAAMLSEHPDLQLVVEGHTDNVGTATANQTLSEKRAAAVRQALIDGYGVNGTRLTAKGLGATKPVAPNESPEGRQNNRRVELVKA